MNKLTIALLCLVLLSACSKVPAESGNTVSSFWDWFKANEAHLAEMTSPESEPFADLANQLERLDPKLAFEIGPGPGETKELAISADGKPEMFPEVIKVVQAAPTLKYWKIVAFRQRTPKERLVAIAVSGQESDGAKAKPDAPVISVRADQTRFSLRRNGDVADLMLYVKDYSGNPGQRFMSKMLIQQALGEYDSVMRVGNLEFKPLIEASDKDSKPFVELPSDFDALMGKSSIAEKLQNLAHMGQNRRETNEPSAINEKGSWSVAQAEEQGKPIFIRFNDDAKIYEGNPEFGKQATVTLSFKSADSSGMPSQSEMERLSTLEEIIVRKVNATNQTVFAFATTGDGMRTLNFYTRDSENFKKIVESVQGDSSDYALKLEITDDPHWNKYKNNRTRP